MPVDDSRRQQAPSACRSESDPQTDILACGPICIAAYETTNPEAEWAQVVGLGIVFIL